MNDHDKLRALAAKWRDEADYLAGNSALHRRKCADELEAALAALGGKGEAVSVEVTDCGAFTDYRIVQPEAQGEAVAWMVVSERAGEVSAEHSEIAADATIAKVTKEYGSAYGRIYKRPLVYGDTAAPKPEEGVTELKAEIERLTEERDALADEVHDIESGLAQEQEAGDWQYRHLSVPGVDGERTWLPWQQFGVGHMQIRRRGGPREAALTAAQQQEQQP